ncbi:MAG: cytidylate kinase-like family protein [Eubacterium sp.]|nr:cytidylate kinase-like family protein [Eubacterium sp.]
MKDHYIIAIGRQFVSGGRQIGHMLADKLGIDFYDSNNLREEAKKLGIEDGIFDLFDEKPTRSFLFSVVMDPYAIDSAVNSGKVIEAQRKVIQAASEKGPCVIVGRRADKILEDTKGKNVLSVFIAADMEDRVARFLEREDMNEKQAVKFIEKKDRERASYYNYFFDGKWGRADNYSMCFSTSRMTKEKIVDIICDYLENWE